MYVPYLKAKAIPPEHGFPVDIKEVMSLTLIEVV